MEFLDYFFWGFAVFALIYGIGLLIGPQSAFIPTIKKQLVKKGHIVPSDEDVDKRLKQFRIWGVVCIAASGVLVALLLTGGIFT